MNMPHARVMTLVAIVLTAAALRLLPHPPNFVPIGAMALFGGAMFARGRLALAVPLAAMIVSDLILAAVFYGTSVFASMPFVYAGFAIYVGLGRLVRRRVTPLRIGAATLTGSVAFFLITNFGSWLRGLWYPMTLEGLVACYTAAIPFFRHTLASDVLYTAILFGGFALAQRHITALRESGPALTTTPAHD